MKILPGVIVGLMCAAVLALTVAAEDEKLVRDAKKLYDTALRTAKAREIKDQQLRLLKKAWDKVEIAELGRVIDHLRLVEEPPRSFPAVLNLLVVEHLKRRFGDEPAREIENLPVLIADTNPEMREALLAESMGLADLRFARHLALKEARAEETVLRRRAALYLGDLMEYGADDGNVSGTLVALLDDPDAGVRAVAVRRSFKAGLDVVFNWAIANLDDGEKATIPLRGAEETLIPGEEALRGLAGLTRIHEDLLHRQYREMSPEQKSTARELFRAWWKDRGERFPPPGFREADFRREPSVTKVVVIKPDADIATFPFWSVLDRTKIRIVADELELSARTPLDFEVHFHVRYMAQGMRSDDGEGYRRNLPVGEKYILARKAIGCYVLVFQRMTGDRLGIHLQFHDLEEL
jgi:hypothetical protein